MKSFGPIVILAPVDAIPAVVARTVANLCPSDWDDEDDGQDEAEDVC